MAFRTSTCQKTSVQKVGHKVYQTISYDVFLFLTASQCISKVKPVKKHDDHHSLSQPWFFDSGHPLKSKNQSKYGLAARHFFPTIFHHNLLQVARSRGSDWSHWHPSQRCSKSGGWQEERESMFKIGGCTAPKPMIFWWSPLAPVTSKPFHWKARFLTRCGVRKCGPRMVAEANTARNSDSFKDVSFLTYWAFGNHDSKVVASNAPCTMANASGHDIPRAQIWAAAW